MIRPWKRVYNEGEDTPDINLGITNAQYKWITNAYEYSGEHRCQFPIYNDHDGWDVCGGESNLHLHHIHPKRHLWQVNQIDPDNDPTNLIFLCKTHHLGSRAYKGPTDWRNEVVPIIHCDIEWARRRYQGSDSRPTTYDKVFKGRQEIVSKGDTYWNTDYDEYFVERATDIINNYFVSHPDPYPLKDRND